MSGRTQRVRRGLAAALAVAAASLATTPQVAHAAWQAGTTGRSYAHAVSVPRGGAPAGSVAGRDVTVSWPITRLPDTSPVGGYRVRRFDASSGASQTVAASCAGTIATLTCVEDGVAPGSWTYAITPVEGQWLGAESPASAAVTVASPSLSLSVPTITSLPVVRTGSLASFLDGASVTFRLDDPSSGAVLAGSTTPSPVPAGGSAGMSVTVPLGTSLGSHTVYAVDALGDVASASIQVVDATPPTVTGAVIGKTQGGTPGFVKQAGTFYVYANANDPGSVASGVSLVTANVSAFALGQIAVPLVPGSYSVGGVTYGYRSLAVLATSPLAAGSKSFTVTATDLSLNSGTLTASATVDNTAPAAADVQTTNRAGGTVGKAETGDSITYTFSEAIDPNSVLAGWTGSATSVTLHLNNVSGGDTVTVFNGADTLQLNLGSVNLSRTGYTSANVVFTGSTMTMSGSTITIVLGSPSGSTSTVANTGAMVWSPSTAATDLAGNACSVAAATESGGNDKDF